MVPPPRPIVSNPTPQRPQRPQLAAPPPWLSLRCPLQPRGDIGHGDASASPCRPVLCIPPRDSLLERWAMFTSPLLCVDTYLPGNSSPGPAMSDPMTLGKSLRHLESLRVFSCTISGFVVRTESQNIPGD